VSAPVLGPRRTRLGWLPIDRCHFDEVVAAIAGAAVGGRPPLRIATANVDFAALARTDADFGRLLAEFELVVADGVPLLWVAEVGGTPLHGRVNGTDLVEACASVSVWTGARVALVGAGADVGRRAAEALRARHPGCAIVPVETPWLSTEREAAEVADRVRSESADVVLVGLGAPRQERWIAAHLERSGAKVGIGVGGSFDILAGDAPRAPHWMQRSGLEWAWRLGQDPGRLAKRYLWRDAPTLARLVAAVLVDRARRRLDRRAGPEDLDDRGEAAGRT
jgi:N-acetylglucosaminyldiphosphoundecaprenol N-acetyl-beta-D-mannosaminyltransferase